jgi:hypothetical protein
VFIIKSDHGLSEIDYDIIAKWARNILTERNKHKENFYAAKSMMKSLGLEYQKINMCPNFCILYDSKNVDLLSAYHMSVLVIKSGLAREELLSQIENLDTS